jgi:hypothetical protein
MTSAGNEPREGDRLVVARDDKTHARLVPSPSGALASGEALLQIERFGLTSNNVTYAALNRTMPYLNFFQSPDSDLWGALPVWGFGRVEATRHDEVPAGALFYGFFPAARFVVLTPRAVRGAGFRVERADIPPQYTLYGQYHRTEVDPFHLPGREDAIAVFRPLFLTGLALADYLSSDALASVDTIIISSASSKTAYGLASALRAQGARRPVIGLSAPAHVAFVESLGVYDRVEAYDAVRTRSAVPSAVHVDIAGSGVVNASIRDRLGASLRLTLSVGISHGDAGGYSLAREEPGTEVFFAPGWMARRRAELGDAFLPSMLEGWRAQMSGVEKHFTIQRRHGPVALRDTYLALATGGASRLLK